MGERDYKSRNAPQSLTISKGFPSPVSTVTPSEGAKGGEEGGGVRRKAAGRQSRRRRERDVGRKAGNRDARAPISSPSTFTSLTDINTLNIREKKSQERGLFSHLVPCVKDRFRSFMFVSTWFASVRLAEVLGHQGRFDPVRT